MYTKSNIPFFLRWEHRIPTKSTHIEFFTSNFKIIIIPENKGFSTVHCSHRVLRQFDVANLGQRITNYPIIIYIKNKAHFSTCASISSNDHSIFIKIGFPDVKFLGLDLAEHSKPGNNVHLYILTFGHSSSSINKLQNLIM